MVYRFRIRLRRMRKAAKQILPTSVDTHNVDVRFLAVTFVEPVYEYVLFDILPFAWDRGGAEL